MGFEENSHMADNKEPGPRAEALWTEPIGGKVLEGEEQSAGGYIPSDLLCLDYDREVMCEVNTMYYLLLSVQRTFYSL